MESIITEHPQFPQEIFFKNIFDSFPENAEGIKLDA